MKANIISLLIAALSMGLMAGIFFTWSNAVKPGIGKLSNMGYLEALQAMNKVILNPAFYSIFFIAVLAIPLASFLNYNTEPSYVSKILIGATIIYLVGVFLITLLGNIPLNNILENTKLSALNDTELRELRNTIEVKWNLYNLVRTIASFISFLLVLISMLKVTK